MHKCETMDTEPAWLKKTWPEVDAIVRTILERRKRTTKEGRLLFPCADFRMGRFRQCMKKAGAHLE